MSSRLMVGGLFTLLCPLAPRLGMAAPCPDGAAATQTLSDLAHSAKDVRWDSTSMVCADFNGDGVLDQAVLGYRDHTLLLAVRRGRKQGRHVPQILEFAIGGGVQEGVCTLPVTLTLRDLACDTGDGLLPGCKAGKGVKALSIQDGECDPINLYWSHEDRAMLWWRY